MTIVRSPEQVPAPIVRAGNLIAVASGKGGVGKTWFAITLSHAFARAGQRTLLFDGDLGLANVDIQLGLMPVHDLGSVLNGRMALAQAKMPFADGGFDIIAGRSGSGRLAGLPPTRLHVLGGDLVSIAGGYDKVLLDLGAGVDRTVRQLTRNVGTCIVVISDEPTSLTDAYAFVKLTYMEQPGADIRIVVNMAASGEDGARTYQTLHKACTGFLNMSPPLLGVVRRDPRVREAIRSQVSLLTRFPTSEAAHDVEQIAACLLNSRDARTGLPRARGRRR